MDLLNLIGGAAAPQHIYTSHPCVCGFLYNIAHRFSLFYEVLIKFGSYILEQALRIIFWYLFDIFITLALFKISFCLKIIKNNVDDD